jgi:hypothetical protein
MLYREVGELLKKYLDITIFFRILHQIKN